MPGDPLIVALDLPDALSALALARRLGSEASFYKIGLGLLTGGGLALAAELRDDHGKHVFLDLKLFDIPATIEAAVRGVARWGVDLLTVHGDPAVVAAAKLGAAGTATKILAVTILTSQNRADLDAALIRPGPVADIVLARARAAFAAGADGVVASPAEAAAIRALPESAGRLVVTPGIRPPGSPPDDQKRTATPAAALAAGATHIVVGRPIHAAPDPLAALRAIRASL